MKTQPELIAHWPLGGDADDAVGDHHGRANALTYTAGPDGKAGGAAEFDGRHSRIRVEDHPNLRLGTGDFTFTAWIRCQAPMTHVFGDILSKFDPVGRSGLNLHVAGSSPAYSAMSDQRHVHFGIDDGYIGNWEDFGKPEPSNSNVTTLVTWQGELYAGIADAATPQKACRVFRYDGDQRWQNCGRLGADANVLSVQSMLVHNGRLYAGSGNWDWDKARGDMPGFTPSKVHVYEYQGGTEWRDLGQVGEGYRVMCLGSFAGELYAGMDQGAGGGKVFRYSGGDWIDCGAPDGLNVESFLPSGGVLYVSTHGNIYRYEGDTRWTCIGKAPHGITQIHCMAEMDGQLCAATGSCFSRAEHQDAEDTLGRVHGFRTGQVCSHEHDIGSGWTHIAAVRQDKETRLYINGSLAAVSHAPPRTTFDLTNTSPLFIGYGTQTYFKGVIADVRMYAGALTAEVVGEFTG
jgi:hypothetical protein